MAAETVEQVVRSVPTARFVLIPEGDQTVGHLTLTLPSVWKGYLRELVGR